jgi:GNAT superfamily N-acetyltransferase
MSSNNQKLQIPELDDGSVYWAFLRARQLEGTLSHDLFEQTVCEMWTMDLQQRSNPPDGHVRMSWAVRETKTGVVFHCREFLGPGHERIAWSFVMQREDNKFEVEEFFVRPTYRRKGFGRGLVKMLKELTEGSELKIWISYADSGSENLPVIEKLVKLLGLRLQQSDERWAPLVAKAN